MLSPLPAPVRRCLPLQSGGVLAYESRGPSGRANEAAATTQDANRRINHKVSHADALRWLHFFCVSGEHLSAPFTRPVLVLISVPRRHVDDCLSQCCWTAWAAHSAVVPSVPLPLGHDVTAIRADRRMIGGMTSATYSHFIACPAVGTSVPHKLHALRPQLVSAPE